MNQVPGVEHVLVTAGTGSRRRVSSSAEATCARTASSDAAVGRNSCARLWATPDGSARVCQPSSSPTVTPRR